MRDKLLNDPLIYNAIVGAIVAFFGLVAAIFVALAALAKKKFAEIQSLKEAAGMAVRAVEQDAKTGTLPLENNDALHAAAFGKVKQVLPNAAPPLVDMAIKSEVSAMNKERDCPP